MPINVSSALLTSGRLATELRIIDPQRFRVLPLPFGRPADEVRLDPAQLQTLLRSAVAEAAGADDRGQVLWRSAGSDLLLLTADLRVQLGDGLIALSLPLRCDQTGDSAVHASFAVGSPQRPAGLLSTTEERPRGPAVVVDIWGERLLALMWQALVGLMESLAAESGRDEDGAPLLPAALSANADGVLVQPMARHAFDRARQG